MEEEVEEGRGVQQKYLVAVSHWHWEEFHFSCSPECGADGAWPWGVVLGQLQVSREGKSD